MKQLLQRLDTGDTVLEEVPVPGASGNKIVVESRASVISAGTERSLVEFGRASLWQKARSQPEKVREVLDKVHTDGIAATVAAVRAKLDTPITLGYCQAGIVVDAGPEALFRPGDRVVTNGSHAEYVRVPSLLAARIPDGVDFEAAAFAPVAAIGLQGIRNASPALGETVVVYGLGLIGLLSVQLLRANGCRVIGIDGVTSRVEFARRFGACAIDGTAGDVVAQVRSRTQGVGADAVLLTLASDSDEPILRAAEMSRKKGRLVLVGVTGLRLSRDSFYKKELSFTVSCSYGAGRYDKEYEEAGHDYPLPYVRWTEQRNFAAVLDLMLLGALDPKPLISHSFPFRQAPAAYDLLSGPEPSLGVVLTYQDRGGVRPGPEAKTIQKVPVVAVRPGHSTIGVIGAGNFALRTLLPALRQAGAHLHTIASAAGTTGAIAGAKFGFERITTDAESVLSDPALDGIVILTRHDTHAPLAIQALEAGKHVFVEKPLALTETDLDLLEAAATGSLGSLTVGFNRRFAPLTVECQKLLAGRGGPLVILATMNAGMIPRDHWIQDPKVGGGRIIGEACHILDLVRALTQAPISGLSVRTARDGSGMSIDDIALLTVGFADGSTAAIQYLANGARTFPKERVECFFDGKTVVIENWRRLRRYGIRGPRFERPRRMDKGHHAEIVRWLATVQGEAPPLIPLDEIFEVSRWAVRAAEAARNGTE